MRKKKNQHKAVFLTSMLAILLLGITSIRLWEASTLHAVQARENARLGQMESKKVNTLQQEIKQEYVPKEQHEKDLKKKDEEIQTIKSSKAAEKAKLASVKVTTPNASVARADTPATKPVGGPVAGCGDNEYAHFIYMHESGCQTHNPNGSGCDGIGQACPSSKVIGPCGYDYACQNAWFTAYANRTYGGWAKAYQFWLSNRWW